MKRFACLMALALCAGCESDKYQEHEIISVNGKVVPRLTPDHIAAQTARYTGEAYETDPLHSLPPRNYTTNGIVLSPDWTWRYDGK